MSEKVKFVLSKPEKVVRRGEYWGIVLPTVRDNLTVINGRAPSLVYLNPGVIKLMDSPDNVCEKIYVSEGIAEIANNQCNVSSEYILLKKEISLAEAQERLNICTDEKEQKFYQAICDDLSAFA